MADVTTKRVLAYAALFAGGSFLASPIAGMGMGIATGAAAVASLFGNTLAADIHTAVSAGSLNPLSNRHLHQLVGNALASLIECYAEENSTTNFAGRLVSSFRRSDAELSALAKTAKQQWTSLELTGEGVALQSEEICKAFRESSSPSSHEPLVSADEWDRCLTAIALHAQTMYGDGYWLDKERRRPLAEYVAARFALAVRELVRADLDPAVGTGGRIFIALHLDLMSSMSASLRSVGEANDQLMGQIGPLQQQIARLSDVVVASLSHAQKADVFDLVTTIRDEHEQTRALLDMGFTEQRKNNDLILAEIRAGFAKRNRVDRVGDESIDHLLDALTHFAESGQDRGLTVMKLSRAGRYSDAASEAAKLAEAEDATAAKLADAAGQARSRAAQRWRDAGDIAVVSDWQKAAHAYERSIDLDPENPIGWGRLAQVFLWLGKRPEALSAFTRVWYMLPEGIQTVIRAVDGDAAQAQQDQFLSAHPEVSRETYLWSIRGLLIAGLNIAEILRSEPALVSQWIMRVVSLDMKGDPQRPTEEEAPSIVELTIERVYSLGGLLGLQAAGTEHRRVLEELAHIAQQRGEFEESDQYLRRARDMSVEMRDFVAEAVYLCNLGAVAAERGQVQTARAYLEQALALCKGDAREAKLVVSKRLFTLAELEQRQVEIERRRRAGIPESVLADDEIEVCNRLADEFSRDTESAMEKAIKLKEVEGNAHGNLAKMAKSLGDVSLAEREYEMSFRIHESIGFKSGVARTSAALAKLRTKPAAA